MEQGGIKSLLIFVLLLYVLPGSTSAEVKYYNTEIKVSTHADRSKFAPHQIVFKFFDTSDQQGKREEVQKTRQKVARKHRISKMRAVFAQDKKHFDTVHLGQLPEDISPLEACQALKADEAIEWAEPLYYRYIQNTTPNDTYFYKQESLKNIGLPSAWDITTGSYDVIIAILDTRVDWQHPDLQGNI